MSKFISREEIFEIEENTALSPKILMKLEEASICLGELNQFSSDLFEFDFIVEAIKNIEALNSARIEGTTGNLEDLYRKDSLDYEAKKKLKLFSAINYRTSIAELERIYKTVEKIDKRFIRHLHKVLTENDPSTSGTPGKFREKEVKIMNSKLGDFYPADPVKINEYIDELVAEPRDRRLPHLICAAIMHYRFEAIHPFEDGNGRTGRILITARLLLEGIISEPILNLSQYLERHRDEYVASLRSVSDEQSFEKWTLFFLDGITQQCKHNLKIIERMREMKGRNEAKIRETIKGSSVALNTLHFSLNNLFVSVPDVSEHLKKMKIPLSDYNQTARVNINRLVEMGILDITSRKKGRAQVYVHKELFDMLMQ